MHLGASQFYAYGKYYPRRRPRRISFASGARLNGGASRERMVFYHLNGGSRKALDGPQGTTLLRVTEGEGDPRGAGARRAADPVHVALGLVRASRS